VTAERIARQGFLDRPATTVRAAARLTTAIQAQDPVQSRFGVRSRSAAVTAADVFEAIEERSVVRTWAMRATIHLVDRADVRWLTRLIGPTFAARFRKRWLDIGLTPDVLRRTADALPDVLADGPRSRAEIVTALAARGVHIPAIDDQAPIHVLLHATGVGLICRGPDRGRLPTFTLLDDWLADAPAGPDGDDALAELARRYFTAFAPATAADFTTWSGLPAGRTLALVRDELEPVEVNGRPGFRRRTDRDLPAVPRGSLRLAAGYDNYLVGYRDRSLQIADEHRRAVYVGGVIKPTVLVDGRVVATWRVAQNAEHAAVTVTALAPLTRAVRHGLDREVADLGRFLQRPTSLSVEE
jgi:hypothetical protein